MPTAKTILDRKGSEVVTVASDVSVLEAAHVMNAHKIGALVVTSGDRAVGIFTERDILNRVVAVQLAPAETSVADVMSAPMACCKRSTTLMECRNVMTQRKIRHLPVVEEGQLFGIISSTDLLAAQSLIHQDTIEYLSEYLHGRV